LDIGNLGAENYETGIVITIMAVAINIADISFDITALQISADILDCSVMMPDRQCCRNSISGWKNN